MGSAPIGALIAGVISDRFGVTTSMFVGGTMVVIVALALLAMQRQRREEGDVAPAETGAPRHQSAA